MILLRKLYCYCFYPSIAHVNKYLTSGFEKKQCRFPPIIEQKYTVKSPLPLTLKSMGRSETSQCQKNFKSLKSTEISKF